MTVLPVDCVGQVDPNDVRNAINSNTVLISIMHANNEVGTLHPIRDIAAIARSHGVLMHTDAAQSLGKIPVNVGELGVDLLTIVGHKLYAPKGSAALHVRRGVQLEPLVHGAGHEGGRRAGTESVPNIVGLGAACRIAQSRLPEESQRLQWLRDRLYDRLSDKIGARLTLNGRSILSLPNTLNVSFIGLIGAELLARVPEVAASTGSACHEGRVSTSPVLHAMGVPLAIAQGAVRFSVGRMTTEAEIDAAADFISDRA